MVESERVKDENSLKTLDKMAAPNREQRRGPADQALHFTVVTWQHCVLALIFSLSWLFHSLSSQFGGCLPSHESLITVDWANSWDWTSPPVMVLPYGMAYTF